MMVGGGVDEELVPEESRPGDEWPPPLPGLELTNKDGPSSRLLFLTVQYVGDEAAAAATASYNTGLGGFTELEQKVVSPLDPNMGCTACYSPVYRPTSPLMPPPVSPSESYLTPASPSASTSLPEPSMIVLSDQCQFAPADSFMVTEANRLYEDQGKLLLLSDASQPTELVVAGDRACGDQRVELLLSNGTIAYGIVGSPDTTGTRVIQIPREYLVATQAESTNIPETHGNLQTENIQQQCDQVQNVQDQSGQNESRQVQSGQDENGQDENGHLRALYNTLKEQGLIIEPGDLRLEEPDLDQNQPLLDTSLLDLQPDYNVPELQKYWCEECNELLDNSCREHQINRKISDKAVPSRARATLPASYLAINQIPDNDREEFGVFARKNIPKRTQFGPMEGVIIKPGDLMLFQEAPHLDLTIETENGELRTLDVSNEHMSNWMRFVRMAAPDRPPNLLLSQLGASLFFTTTQTIHPREELLVWYSPAYAMRRQLPADPPPPVWTCGTCGEKLKTYFELTKHATCHIKATPAQFGDSVGLVYI